MKPSQNTLTSIAKLFIGNSCDCFPRLSGPQIYDFFNKRFGRNDTYWNGKPVFSRHIQASERLLYVLELGRINDFFNIILSRDYFHGFYPEESAISLEERSALALRALNEILKSDSLRVIKVGDSFQLVDVTDDEVFLGKGGFAEVYYLKSSGLVEKRLMPEWYKDKGIVSRFKREFDLMKSLSDIDGVIRVYDFDKQRIAFTMERCETDLDDFVRNNSLDDGSKRIIIHQIVHIMGQVHARDAIHRDLSPTNIFVSHNMCKIADFGLGKALGANYSHQTASTFGMGQNLYTDPKVLEGLKNGSKQSDVFSLGKVINFVMTKTSSDTNHIYRAVSEKCCCEESQRFQDANEVADALKRIDKKLQEGTWLKDLDKRINESVPLNSEDIESICRLNKRQLFDYCGSRRFVAAFELALRQMVVDEGSLGQIIQQLQDYYQMPRTVRMPFKDFDRAADIAIPIILSECSYTMKEKAIDLLNIPLDMNRFAVQRMVRERLIDSIDPTLEELIHIAS